jgi:hypothetical protein
MGNLGIDWDYVNERLPALADACAAGHRSDRSAVPPDIGPTGRLCRRTSSRLDSVWPDAEQADSACLILVPDTRLKLTLVLQSAILPPYRFICVPLGSRSR